MSDELRQLVAPIDTASFVDEHFGSKPLFVARDDATLASLFSFVHSDRWVPFARELEAASRVDGVQRQTRITPEQIVSCFGNGMTICADISSEPTLGDWLRRFAHGLRLIGTPFAKLYASPSGMGFATHFDVHHVFVCQVIGSKKWRYSQRPAIEAPDCNGKVDRRGQPVWAFPRDEETIVGDNGEPLPPPTALEEVTLTPGDCLYLPPGTWHVAEAVEKSVAVSISPPRTPVYQLIAKTLEDLLMTRVEWRRDVFTRDSKSVVPADVADVLASRLRELEAMIGALDPRALHRVWRSNAWAHHRGSAAPPTSVARTTILVHRDEDALSFLVAPQRDGDEAVFFYADGSELSLPIASKTFVERLREESRFVVSDALSWDASLNDDDALEILQELTNVGLLREDQGT